MEQKVAAKPRVKFVRRRSPSKVAATSRTSQNRTSTAMRLGPRTVAEIEAQIEAQIEAATAVAGADVPAEAADVVMDAEAGVAAVADVEATAEEGTNIISR